MNVTIESTALQQARTWLIESSKPLEGIKQDDRVIWFEDATERHIKAMIDIYYRGGWEAFVDRTFQEMVA